MSYQEIYAGHQMNSEEFYKKFFDDDDTSHCLFDQKKKLSKVCAFTHIKLKVPVRSKYCTQIKCVYEYENIQILFEDAKQNNRTSEIQCLICDQTIKKEDLFYDSELVKALSRNVRCYVQKKKDSQNSINGNKQKNYIIVDKSQKELIDEIQELNAGQLQLIENDQNFQILSILGLTLYKQRMETLVQLRDSNNQWFRNFGQEELELEKKQYHNK